MLTEKLMEEAIIACPEKYVEEGLTLINRQFRMGSYIFDLLFEDRHGAKLIIELQKGTLDRDHTSRNPDQFVELMIIANKIPRARRNRLLFLRLVEERHSPPCELLVHLLNSNYYI